MNTKQILSLAIVVLGVLMVSTTQLTDIVGPTMTKTIVSLSSILNSILAGTLGVLTSQMNTVKDVQDMPGVDKIVVNKDANSTLANLAVDPANAKIESNAADQAAVQRTANQ